MVGGLGGPQSWKAESRVSKALTPRILGPTLVQLGSSVQINRESGWGEPGGRGMGFYELCNISLESPLDNKEIKPVNPKGNQP